MSLNIKGQHGRGKRASFTRRVDRIACAASTADVKQTLKRSDRSFVNTTLPASEAPLSYSFVSDRSGKRAKDYLFLNRTDDVRVVPKINRLKILFHSAAARQLNDLSLFLVHHVSAVSELAVRRRRDIRPARVRRRRLFPVQ
ncbi:hypothetical protein EVAR_8882_1 [Eumeta japonica]|uniref:Uncharacterized protein n=1 Tax=Eumeta variegata TaxID=151549 RepID=A0A4C1U079_EUMVA|nr:hypothetical protein EVAR_8882_1 [Eumeta japonica]